jgi:hypothetical protein
MPTTLERTTITHTPPVNRLLRTAATKWPDATGPRELMLRLMAQGAATLREQDLAAQYQDAYEDWAGSEDERLWSLTFGDGSDS